VAATLYHSRGGAGLLENAAFVRILSQFIDKQKIIATVENGYGEPLDMSTTPLSVEDAQSALASLGYRLSNGALTRGGTTVGISIATTNDPKLVALANMLATECRKLGITVSIRNFDQGFFQTELINKTFTTVLLKGTEPPTSYQAVLPLYNTTTPFVVRTKAKIVLPPILVSPMVRYAHVNEWFINTDKLYPLLAKNKTQTTN
ncbi:hypothetical protein K2Q02_01140, partial [Patescibacteria group bacterium]|nr:hypothetical protein [Patescibacteria group bacterium]